LDGKGDKIQNNVYHPYINRKFIQKFIHNSYTNSEAVSFSLIHNRKQLNMCALKWQLTGS